MLVARPRAPLCPRSGYACVVKDRVNDCAFLMPGLENHVSDRVEERLNDGLHPDLLRCYSFYSQIIYN
jgi:hypothetical protein